MENDKEKKAEEQQEKAKADGTRHKPLTCDEHDYRKPCPQGWTLSLDQSQCSANPEEYRPPPGCKNKKNVKELSSKVAKKQWAEDCQVAWPCRDVAREARVLRGDVDGPRKGDPDYEQLCPDGWSYSPVNGTCTAKYYDGSCLRTMNFLGHTNRMKASWAEMCGVSWPEWPPPEISEDTALNAQQERLLIIRKKKEFNMEPYAVWENECNRSYSVPCPVGWTALNSATGEVFCSKPPELRTATGAVERFVPGSTELCPKTVQVTGWTGAMKAAFEKHCEVFYPCQGGHQSGASTFLALGTDLHEGAMPMTLRSFLRA